MAIITNTHKTEVGLPNGQLLKPGVPTNVPDWPEIGQNLVVKAWVRAKILVVEGQDEAPVKKVVQEEVLDETDQLIAELATYGINKNRRSSVETLQKVLAQAKADVAASSAESEGDEADA